MQHFPISWCPVTLAVMSEMVPPLQHHQQQGDYCFPLQRLSSSQQLPLGKHWQKECRGMGHTSPSSAFFLPVLPLGESCQLEAGAFYPSSHLLASCVVGQPCTKVGGTLSNITSSATGHLGRWDTILHVLCPIRSSALYKTVITIKIIWKGKEMYYS